MEGTVPTDKLSEIASRLERLPFTSWQVKAILTVGVATFFDAFDILAVSFALPVLIVTWSIKPQQIGFMIAAASAGQFVGALFFGWLADRVGRLRTTILTVLGYSAFSFFCAASWSYTSLLIGRIIQGLGLGGEVPVAAAYINEITKAKGRGRFVLLYEMVFPVGLMVAAVAGYWIVPRFGWRWLFIIGGVPAAIAAIYMGWGLPESPRWLADVGRNEAAEKTMTEIEKKVKAAFGTDLPKAVPIPAAASVGKQANLAELFKGIYLRRTILLWVLCFSAYLTFFGISTWLPSLYVTVFKLPVSKALLYSMVTNFAVVVGCFLAAMLVDKVGRRTWISLSFFCAAASLFVLWLTGASAVIHLVIFASVAAFFLGSISLVLYLYMPELYPTRTRALGVCAGSSWLRVASVVGPVVIGTVVAHYTLSWAFLLFAVVSLIGGIATGLFGVETKGQVLEQISP